MAGKVLEIDALIAEGNEVKNRIEKIGVELEGGWEHLPVGTILERDGSVHVDGKNGVPISVGELPSPPKVPAAMWPWMRKYYPQHVNDTCGMHVHMSFESARHYQLLMVEDYQTTMLAYLEKWGKRQNLPKTHPLWNRIAGKVRYCSLNFWPDKQAKAPNKSYNMDREGHRYTAINYCFAKDNCQTVECRVLPMFDNVEQSIDALKQVLLVTNACLVKLGAKEPRLSEDFILNKDSGSYIDESWEVIR